MRKIIPFMVFALVLILTACNSSVELPDLSGQSENNTMILLGDLYLVPEIEYVVDLDVDDGDFVGYKDYNIGDVVEKNLTITVLISKNTYDLPDLTGKDVTNIEDELDTLGVSYELNYVYDASITENYLFIAYDDYTAGQSFPAGETLIVNVSYDGYFLPDITGLTKVEAAELLEYEFIENYAFEYVVDDSMPEDEVAGYALYEAGDPAYEDETIIINLYKNTFTDNAYSLFFSKYLEGDNSDNALEIYNPTDETVDLSEYHVAIFLNGSYEASIIVTLDGMLAPQETYLLVSSGTSTTLKDKADKTSNRLSFDGNDTIQLRYNNDTYIDTIYDLGNKLFIMENELFIRDENTVKGNRDYTYNEWVAFIPSYFEPFGTFPNEIPESFTISDEYLNNQIGLDTVSGMQQVEPATINDGDTIAFTPGYLGDSRVRFLGVDTPETYPNVDPWGLEAKAFTTNIINNGSVFYLQSDPDLGFTETYGRTLAYVWVDGVMLNYELVKNGFSYNYLDSESKLVFENRYLFRWFEDAETYARENELGIHS